MAADDLPSLPPHERPFEDVIAKQLGYEYIAYRTIEDARKDAEAIVILQGDCGGQIYLTCPLIHVRCSQTSLERLLIEMGLFAWGDGEELYFERARPDRFVRGGMGGGLIEDDVWIHRKFRNLCEVGIDILPDVKAVIDGRSDSVLPGIVAKLVSYLGTVDVSAALGGQANFGFVGDIADQLSGVGKPATAALPILRKLEGTGQFDGSDLSANIRTIENAARDGVTD